MGSHTKGKEYEIEKLENETEGPDRECIRQPEV